MYKYKFNLDFQIPKWMDGMLIPYDWDQNSQFTENDVDEDMEDERDDIEDVFGDSDAGEFLNEFFELKYDEDNIIIGGTIKGEGDSEVDPDEIKHELKTMERLCNTYIKGDWDYE